MSKFLKEPQVDGSALADKRVAVLGFGSQGRAHALNLRDRGVTVRVGLYPESPSRIRAEAEGLDVLKTGEAVAWADVISFCVPDGSMAQIYADSVEPNIGPNSAIVFVHGFNVHFGLIPIRSDLDVILVSPKGPGPRLRDEFLRGSGLAGMFSVHQDVTCRARDLALGYAWGIGCSRIGLLETTFQEETECDLFGEQAVLCGGIPWLIQIGFETLVEAGFQPEVAYFETLHEVKLIVDMLYEGGLAAMPGRISETAEWGAYKAGPEIANSAVREAMQRTLARIQSGEFASGLMEEITSGRKRFAANRAAIAEHPIEAAGNAVRSAIFSKPAE